MVPSYTQSVLSDRPVYLQTKSYSAKDDRKPLADILAPGIVGTGDFLVTLTSGMGISVAAGVAYILGQNVADQGLYRQYAATTTAMTVTASNPTNPRIDQVILRVMDGDSDTSGAYEGRIEIVPGTPTAGATLVNRNGHADLAALLENSKSVLWLADILVPATAVSLVGGNLADKRVRTSIGGGNVPLGGGSSIAASIGTTKGDMIGFSASATPVRIPAAAGDGYRMTSDSSQTSGLRWKIEDGWNALPGAWTYGTTDGTTFTITSTTGDYTGIIQPGMRLMLTHASAVKKFLITKVAFATGTTTLTIYGGTDFTITNSALTLLFFSGDKIPYGFNVSREKWTEIVLDTTSRSQSSPTFSWYNLGSFYLDVPIGAWNLSYRVAPNMYVANEHNYNNWFYITLSTGSTGESDADFTTAQYFFYDITSPIQLVQTMRADKDITLAAKTRYYLNMTSPASDGTANTSLVYQNNYSKAIIRAVSSYL